MGSYVNKTLQSMTIGGVYRHRISGTKFRVKDIQLDWNFVVGRIMPVVTVEMIELPGSDIDEMERIAVSSFVDHWWPNLEEIKQ